MRVVGDIKLGELEHIVGSIEYNDIEVEDFKNDVVTGYIELGLSREMTEEEFILGLMDVGMWEVLKGKVEGLLVKVK